MATLSSKSAPSGLATLAQGVLADTSVQPNDSPTFADLTATGAFTSLGIDDNASATAVTIDSSGSVLVGKTAIGVVSDGIELNKLDYVAVTRDGDTPLFLNRRTSDGTVAEFRKNNVAVGSIGAQSGNLSIKGGGDVFVVNAGGEGFRTGGLSASAGAIIPLANNADSDNTNDIGVPSVRWDDVYATNGTIQTSDRNEKEAIASLTPTEMLVAARLSSSFKNFKWKDAVAEKGLDAARMHSGIIAQDVQDAFTAEGLDASDYAMFISSTWWETQTDVPAVEAVAEVVDEEGNVVTEAVEAKDAYTRTDTYETLEEAPEGATERTRLGIRYPELLAFVAAYNDQRFLAIEARLTALEAV